MLRFDDIVFGPIHSRRLGSSLGINLLPREGKLCNFDCIYCECGWNRDGREGDRSMPDVSLVGESLEKKLLQCRENGTPVDSITFSGNGEPTLNPQFPEIIDKVIAVRDKFFPKAVISVLTNATTAVRPEIRKALQKVDSPILKLDGPDADAVRIMNRPSGVWSFDAVVEAMKEFNGDFILQTMFLKGSTFDFSQGDNLEKWMGIVRYLSPRQLMVYTLDRPAPMEGLGKYSVDEMKTMLKPLLDEGYDIMIKG